MKRLDAKLPIGVFDSGLGGLTVVKELIKLLPHEDILYLGDTARVPYGPRGEDTIKRFSDEDTRFLIGKKVKAVIIACNTSSAVAGDYLKRKYSQIPIFNVIDSASKRAALYGNCIGIIGTHATIESGAYSKKIAKFNPSAKIYSGACPLFVPFIEEGEINSPALKLIAKDYLRPLKGKIDTLIMGCTHYPIIEKIISKEVGSKVKLVNPGELVAQEIAIFLKDLGLLNSQKGRGDVWYFVTDLTKRFTKMAEMFLGKKINHKLQKIEL